MGLQLGIEIQISTNKVILLAAVTLQSAPIAANQTSHLYNEKMHLLNCPAQFYESQEPTRKLSLPVFLQSKFLLVSHDVRMTQRNLDLESQIHYFFAIDLARIPQFGYLFAIQNEEERFLWIPKSSPYVAFLRGGIQSFCQLPKFCQLLDIFVKYFVKKIDFSKHKIVFKLYVFQLHISVTFKSLPY